MGKTLYLSDLDGTLLRQDVKTSDYTNRTINRLVQKGVVFSYATARSIETASKVTAGLNAEFPVIVYNGTFVLDNKTRRVLYSVLFTEEEGKEIFETFLNEGLYPITYAMMDGRSRFSYIKEKCGRAQWEFICSRINDERAREIFSLSDCLDGDLFYFVCIDEESRLLPVYERLKEKYRCFFSKDIYSGERWLEVIPRKANKALAALAVKELYGCDKIVCFGDGINDIPMFELADEGYAVANAAPELKAIATGIIGSNEEDGVARWLEERFRN